MPSSFVLVQRKYYVANAIASQRLEGLEVDSKTITDLHRIASGEIKVADAIQNIKERVSAGEFQKKNKLVEFGRT